MIPLTRGPAPEVLQKHSARWTEKYLKQCQTAGKKPRPDAKQYGHSEIRKRLESMSHAKCFYCERKLAESDIEIDHYIEVAERPELAFVWQNLYLSCSDCNRHKQPNTVIAASKCLDPCDSIQDPGAHLCFKGETITARVGSSQGDLTIRKYNLNSQAHQLGRSRKLQEFLWLWNGILTRSMRNSSPLSADERQALLGYANPDMPYSLMFQQLLRADPSIQYLALSSP